MHGQLDRGMRSKTQDVFRSVINSRKSYKMLKGASEAVWPPLLEEAMLKGFANYQPEDCRETRILGRFPMRNQFISDYIFRTTGKRRSAKQVGSRLQQLRDTYEGKQLLNSLSQHYNLRDKPTSPSEECVNDASSDSATSSSSGSSQPRATPLDTDLHRTIVRIDILPPGSPASDYTSDLSRRSSSDGVFSSNGVTNVFRPSSQPRPIHSIDPTITFVAHSLLFAESKCTVLCDGVTVHEEVTTLVLVGPCPSDDGTTDPQSLYSVQLVPNFWPLLCQDYDPTRFKIVQEITGSTSTDDASAVMFSAVYHFSYPLESSPPSPATPTGYDTVPSSPFYSSPSSSLWDFDSLSSPSSTGTTDSWSFGSEHHTNANATDPYLFMEPGHYNGAPIPHYSSVEDISTQVSPVSPTSCFPTDLSNYVI